MPTLVVCPSCGKEQSVVDWLLREGGETALCCRYCRSPLGGPGAAAAGTAPPPEAAEGRAGEDVSLIDMVTARLSDEQAELPAFPEVAQRILAVREDPDCDLKDLEAIVTKDPVIAGKIVQVANSSFYRGLKDIESLPDAIMRLGFKEVFKIALAMAMKNRYQGKHDRYILEMRRLWRRAIGSAFTARELASVSRYFKEEEAFLAGLIHDVGCVFIVDTLDRMAERDERIVTLQEDLFQQLLGRMHEEIGNRLLEKWAFPEAIREAVRYHHDPSKVPEGEKLAWILNASDLIVRKLGLDGSEADEKISLANSAPMQALGLNDLDIARLLVTLEDQAREMVESMK